MRDTPTVAEDLIVAVPGELMIWLGPGFPAGGFAYSQGLETAATRNIVCDRTSLTAWLLAIVRNGSLRNDLIFLRLILASDTTDQISKIAELSAALQPSSERYFEATLQGAAFRDAYNRAWRRNGTSSFDLLSSNQTVTFPVAVGLAARDYAFPARCVSEAYAIAILNNLVSASIRLGVVGQFDGQCVLAEMIENVRTVIAETRFATEDDIGSATFLADLACLQHETQIVRLFRS